MKKTLLERILWRLLRRTYHLRQVAIRALIVAPVLMALQCMGVVKAQDRQVSALHDGKTVIETPAPGSTQSGIGVIRGWTCEESADCWIQDQNGKTAWCPTNMGERGGANGYLATSDTRADALPETVCFHPTDNSSLGFSVLVNWNLYCVGENRLDCSGPLTITLGDNGIVTGLHVYDRFHPVYARNQFRIAHFGEEYLTGVSRRVRVPNFPRQGVTAILEWDESLQNFTLVGTD